jgi:hypothetical protein
MKKRAFVFMSLLVFSLTACSTFMPQRYTISADNNVALKSFGVSSINVGTFKGPTNFDNMCRGAGPIAPPDGMSFEAYIQKALAAELKVAGIFDDQSPEITLTGVVEQLSFSSSRGLTSGSWDIGLRVNSSNGKSTFVSEHYEFNSGFGAETACKQTAEAYLPTVQNIIGNLVKSPTFRGLVTP